MNKHTARAGRLAAGAALMALIVAIVAVGQAAAQAAAATAPHIAPVPPIAPMPMTPPAPHAPIATMAVPPSVPAVPPVGPTPPLPAPMSAEQRAEIQAAVAEARQAAREAAQARREAMEEAVAARREAFAAAAEARDAAFAERAKQWRQLPATIETAMAETRRHLAARCAGRGVTMPATADIGALATCGFDHRGEVRAALASARASVAGAKGMADPDRAAALAAIDRALRGLDRAPMRGPAFR